MKLLIILWLFALVLCGAQLRTHYTPLPAVVRRWSGAVVFPRVAIRLEIVRV